MTLRAWLRRLFEPTIGEQVARPMTAIKFPADELLERRIKAAREVMAPVEPKKRLILENPDTFKRPMDL